MYQYYFLFGLALIWTVFAVVQDLKTREIANWLTFSLISFVLAYRAVYALVFDDFYFFVYGFFGVLIFVALGYLFYYAGVFAGGDAKLLFGLGGIFPYDSFGSYGFYGVGFFILLFSIGILYTLIYSTFLIVKNFNSFKKYFTSELKNKMVWLYVCFLIFAILFFIGDIFRIYSWIILFFPFVYFYARAVEKSCMIKLTSPDRLTEGDWLVSDVRVGKKFIKKTVHGLGYDDILLLRKYGKKVLIKSGVPFAPVFLITLLFVVIYLLR
ncbi:MAG: prepilin peptidase [Nanoarchaeota archaeon]